MKSWIILALVIVGMLSLALSYCVGLEVAEDQRWDDTTLAEFDRLELSLHDSMTAGDDTPADFQARYDKLETMRDQLEAWKQTSEFNRWRLRVVGRALIGLALAIQLVSWLHQKVQPTA